MGQKQVRLAAIALAGALVLAPLGAFAQSTGGGASGGAGSSGGAAGTGGTGLGTAAPATPGAAPGAGAVATGGAATASTATHNPVLTESGEVRMSKVVGASVYNDKNEKIATVDDVLVGKDKNAAQAVLSVGGVLGVGAKLVAVPYDQLHFSDTVDANTGRVTMPGGSADALNGMPTFKYAGND